MQSLLSRCVSRWALVMLASAGLAGCTMDKTKAPALSGPSEFGLSMDLRANPEVLERDGSSQSVLRVIAYGPSGQRLPNQRFALSLNPVDAGTLSNNQVLTGADGIATAYYTSASSSNPVQKVTIGATPLAGVNDAANFDNTRTQTVTISLRGANAAVSTFTISPAAPKQFDLVTFDASGTTLNGTACMTQCSFTWTFGNEGSASGEVVTHRFENIGTHTITLTVTGPDNVIVTLRKTVTVTAAAPPDAAIQASSTSIEPGQTVRFTGLLSAGKDGAKIVEWNWDFGNGETGSGPTVSSTYEDVGTYLVTLTVRDSNGQEKSAFVTVTVAEPDPVVP